MAQHPWASHDRVIERGMKPAIDGDYITADGNANNSTTIIYAPAAGKILLVFSISISFRNTSGGAAHGNAVYYQVGTGVVYTLGYVTIPDDTTIVSQKDYFLPYPLLNGFDFRCFSNIAGMVTHGSIYGMLINA